MNKALLDSIKSQISSAVSAVTSHVYYYHLPNQKLLETQTVTFRLNSPANDQSFEDKEAVKYYELEITLNSPTTNFLENQSIYVKNKVYQLTTINPKVKVVTLQDEETLWDDRLNIYREYLNFEVKYS